MADPEKMANDALKIKNAGYRVIKVKLGENKNDVERIKTIRKAIGKKYQFGLMPTRDGMQNSYKNIKGFKRIQYTLL